MRITETDLKKTRKERNPVPGITHPFRSKIAGGREIYIEKGRVAWKEEVPRGEEPLVMEERIEDWWNGLCRERKRRASEGREKRLKAGEGW